MCRLMKVIDSEFSHLEFEDKERIKSIVCGKSCQGSCKAEYQDNVDDDKVKRSSTYPIQPKGIYKITDNNYVKFYGTIENLTCSKLFVWNSVLELFYIIKMSDIEDLRPVKKYPDYTEK